LPWNPSHSHGKIKITSGAGDLANADAMTNTNKANGAPAALSLSAMTSQYFIGGMMPESANRVQESRTVIEIRPFKGGWQCYEGPGVGPYWIGDDAKQSAIVGPSRVRARVGRFSFRTPAATEMVELIWLYPLVA
jgi:hypothetical protein